MVQRCKDRALEYSARGDYVNALTSMMSDIDKHPETRDHKGNQICLGLMMIGALNDRQSCERFINGYH